MKTINTTMKNARFHLDFVNKKIVGTKASFDKASIGYGPIYESLAALMAKHPDFGFEIIAPQSKSNKKKQTYKGLDYKFMVAYINTRPNAITIMAEYMNVKSRAENHYNLTITIQEILNPFKVYCITELDFNAGCDFRKIRNLFYYFFNDDEFQAMPDEVKEHRLNDYGCHVSRQSIAHYLEMLDERNYILQHSGEYIYYFAYEDRQQIVDRPLYLQAWHEYWAEIDEGIRSGEAIYNMRVRYGGVARKQERPQINGIYLNEINTLCDLIQQDIEKEQELFKSSY